MLSDEEITVLMRSHVACGVGDYYGARAAIREAVRMTAERCAKICEEHMGYEMEERAANACAAEIRERIKSRGG